VLPVDFENNALGLHRDQFNAFQSHLSGTHNLLAFVDHQHGLVAQQAGDLDPDCLLAVQNADSRTNLEAKINFGG
jgi:hypothetical protein